MNNLELLRDLISFSLSDLIIVSIICFYWTLLIGPNLMNYWLPPITKVIFVNNSNTMYNPFKEGRYIQLVFNFFLLCLFFFFDSRYSEASQTYALYFIRLGLVGAIVIYLFLSFDRLPKLSHVVLSFFLTICTLFGIYNLFNHTPYLKSKLYWSMGESELSTNQAQAKIYYNKALQINPKSIDKLEKAATFNKLKLHQEAKNELTEILQLDSQNLAALLQRAMISIELKYYRDALIDIDSAFSVLNNGFLSKKNIKIRPSLHFFRSRVLVELGEYDEALKEIELTLNEPPQCKESLSCLSAANAEAYYQKSMILSKLGMHLEANLALSLAKEQEALGINERYVLKY